MTNHFVLTTLAAASTLLAGCSLIPAYERPAAPVAPHYAGAADAAAAKPSESATAVALQWSRYFTDAQLQELIGIALANNRDLRVAALNLDKAQAQFQIQRSALAPQLAAQGSATRGNNQNTGELGNTFIAGVTVPAWELDFFGRIRSLKSAALAQYFATDEARQAYELALVASVAQGWLTLLADEELLELSSRTLATRQESMRLTQLRFDTGISSELDLRQAQSLVEAARVTTAQQKRQRAEHENALVLLLGQELPASARSALQTTRLATIAPMVGQFTALKPAATMPAPITPPTMEWVVETGAPIQVARFTHSADDSSAAIIAQTKMPSVPIVCGSMIPREMVLTTSPPAISAPAVSNTAAMAMAPPMVSAFAPTAGPMLLATSLAPMFSAM